MSIELPPKKNKVIWDADATEPALCEELRKALRSVTDPELGMDVIQLGMVRNVGIEPDHALIKMVLTTPFCPYGPAMMESTRSKAEETLKRDTHIEMSMEPWDPSMMEEDAGFDWGIR
jgi:metal-sulfur cluster biosynthetic enzyme